MTQGLKTYRIEVGLRSGVKDAAGSAVKKNIVEDLHIPVKDVRTIRVYTIITDLSRDNVETLRKELFTDPIIEVSRLDRPLARTFSWIIEVGYKPGVTDNVGRTSREATADIFDGEFSECLVFTSKQYAIKGDISRKQAEAVAKGLLANELIERWRVASLSEFKKEGGIALEPPLAGERGEIVVGEFDLNVSDNELMRISSEGILSLNLVEMRAIRSYFRSKSTTRARTSLGLGADPTDVELEAIAQTWSEHCKHKIFNATIDYENEDGRVTQYRSLFKTFIKGATDKISERVPWLVSVFHDNAGVIRFNDEWNLVMKVETHNSPSSLRRALCRQAARFLRDGRHDARRDTWRAFARQGDPIGRFHRDDRRQDRQGRHPRRDIFFRGAAQRIANFGRSDR
jgi:phosphoribosylformylglycinamidine synthase